jgi:uncharacterized membrane protein
MGKEAIPLGILAILTAIALYIKTDLTILSIVLTILGIALIIFNKEEDTIEQRKDKITKKKK